jgi:hypothetical protein
MAADNGMQQQMVQKVHGGLTVGDIHDSDEPFAFDVHENPYEQLKQRVEKLLGSPLPRIRPSWTAAARTGYRLLTALVVAGAGAGHRVRGDQRARRDRGSVRAGRRIGGAAREALALRLRRALHA